MPMLRQQRPKDTSCFLTWPLSACDDFMDSYSGNFPAVAHVTLCSLSSPHFSLFCTFFHGLFFPCPLLKCWCFSCIQLLTKHLLLDSTSQTQLQNSFLYFLPNLPLLRCFLISVKGTTIHPVVQVWAPPLTSFPSPPIQHQLLVPSSSPPTPFMTSLPHHAVPHVQNWFTAIASNKLPCHSLWISILLQSYLSSFKIWSCHTFT